MPYKYCQHVRENGTFCASGAVKGRAYCYFHLRTRARHLAMAQAQSQQKAWRPELPPLEDMHAVQVALMQVLDALTAEAIDPHRAGLILYGLQQAATNLHHYHDWLQPSRFEPHVREGDGIVDRYPGLEAEFGLPERIDLDACPQELFPPPLTVPKSMTTDAWLIAVNEAIGAAVEEASASRKPPQDVMPDSRRLDRVLPPQRAGGMPADEE
jgi:hypothetical protein